MNTNRKKTFEEKCQKIRIAIGNGKIYPIISFKLLMNAFIFGIFILSIFDVETYNKKILMGGGVFMVLLETCLLIFISGINTYWLTKRSFINYIFNFRFSIFNEVATLISIIFIVFNTILVYGLLSMYIWTMREYKTLSYILIALLYMNNTVNVISVLSYLILLIVEACIITAENFKAIKSLVLFFKKSTDSVPTTPIIPIISKPQKELNINEATVVVIPMA